MEIGKSLPVTRSAPPPEVAAAGDEAHWEGLEETDEFRKNLESYLGSRHTNRTNRHDYSFSDTGLFSVSDQKTNVSTLYSVTAAGVSQVPPTVAIPSA